MVGHIYLFLKTHGTPSHGGDLLKAKSQNVSVQLIDGNIFNKFIIHISTPFMVFSVTYYLELRIVITFFFVCKLWPSEDINVL